MNVLQSLNMVHFHFKLGLRVHQLQIWISISQVMHLDDLQGPLDFNGHGSWSVC